MSDAPPNNPPPPSIHDFPPVREFNDRTTLWLLEDPLNLRDLLRIHRPALVENLEFSQAERINRSFIPADLQKEECDLLFRVPFRLPSVENAAGESPPSVWIYLLLEHQSRPDAMMTLRLLSYMLELWEIQKREWDDRNAPLSERRLTPVVPFVFYTGEDNWNSPLEFRSLFAIPPGFARFIPDWETLFLNLRRTPPETLTSFVNAIGWAMRALQAEKAPYEELETVLREAMQGLEGLSEEQRGQCHRVARYLLLLAIYRRPPAEGQPLAALLLEQTRQSKFFEREEIETMYSYADSLMDKGIAQGIAQGRQEGAQLSLRAILEKILAAKFGPLPDAVTQTIQAANLDTLNGWVVSAAVAKTLAEVGIESAN